MAAKQEDTSVDTINITKTVWCDRGRCQKRQDGPSTPHVHLCSIARPEQLEELMDTELGQQLLDVTRDLVIGGDNGNAQWTSTGSIHDRILVMRRCFEAVEPVSDDHLLNWKALSNSDMRSLRVPLLALHEAFAPGAPERWKRALEKKKLPKNPEGAVALTDTEADAIVDAAKARVQGLVDAQKALLVKWKLCTSKDVAWKWTIPSGADIVAAAAAHGVDLLDLASNPAFDLDGADLGPVFALMSLIDNSGINHSWARSLATDSDAKGLVESPKLRAGKIVALPAADSATLVSFGGVFNTLRALQRVSCEVRRRDRKVTMDKAELLFVARCWQADSLENHPDGWRVFTAMDVTHSVGVTVRRMRETAVHRNARNGVFTGVPGQSRETAGRYLAHGLDEDTLHEVTTRGQDAVADVAERFVADLPLNDGPVAAEHEDLGPVTCETGGHDPDKTESLCSRGPLACFSCPSARLHATNLPGLAALSEVAQALDEKTDESTDYGAIAAAADQALDQLPTRPDPADTAAAVPAVLVFLTEMSARS